jgi:GxxExxY protein
MVLDAAIEIHREPGPGLLESVYETILAHELGAGGLSVRRHVAIPLVYGELAFDVAFRADLVVEERVIIEIKTVEKLNPAHKKQLLTYLKLANLRLGLLMNFSEELMKHGVVRVVNRLDE